MTTTNAERAQRGHRAIELHTDLRPSGIDLETAAIDIIADILHALEDAAVMLPRDREQILERALRTYEGDAEDGDDWPPLDDFVAKHRAEIDAAINAVVYRHDGNGGRGTIPDPAPVYDDEERKHWIENDEGLSTWAQREGVEL